MVATTQTSKQNGDKISKNVRCNGLGINVMSAQGLEVPLFGMERCSVSNGVRGQRSNYKAGRATDDYTPPTHKRC